MSVKARQAHETARNSKDPQRGLAAGYEVGCDGRRPASSPARDLESDIRAWIKSRNDDPKPFVWEKTAEQILDSLAR